MCNNLRESTIQGMTSDMSPLIVSTDSSRVCVNLLQPLTSTWGDCLSNKQQRNLDPSTNRDHQARRTFSWPESTQLKDKVHCVGVLKITESCINPKN
eukprot:gene9127-1427_t